MGSTRASRSAKPETSGKQGLLKDDLDNGSMVAKMKSRKAHESKEAITRGAVKKSDKQAQKALPVAVPRGKRVTPISSNGRVVGRQLIRWTPSTDQLLLLIVEFECRVAGVTIPWDNVAKRLATEKGSTGACCQQRIAKLRKEMMVRGCWVPPLAGRPGTKRSTARGIVMVEDQNGKLEAKDVAWDEDAFQYLDRAEISRLESSPAKPATKVKVQEQAIDVNGDAPRPKRRRYKPRKFENVESSDDENDQGEIRLDPGELGSDDDFNPSLIKRVTRTKKSTKASIKVANDAMIVDSHSEEFDADAEPGLRDIKDSKASKPSTKLNDEEEEKDSLVVVLRTENQAFTDYPEGINETRGINYESDAEQEDAGNYARSPNEQVFTTIENSDSGESHPDSEDWDDDPTDDDESDEVEGQAVVNVVDTSTNSYSYSDSDSDNDEDDSIIPDHYLSTFDLKDFSINYPRLPTTPMDLNHPPSTPTHRTTLKQHIAPNEPKRLPNNLKRRVEENRRLGQLLSSPAYNRQGQNSIHTNVGQNAVGSQSTFMPNSIAQNHIHRHPYTLGGIEVYSQFARTGNQTSSGTDNFGDVFGNGVTMQASDNTSMAGDFGMGRNMGALNNTFMNGDFEMGGTMEASHNTSTHNYTGNQVGGYHTGDNLGPDIMLGITEPAERVANIGTSISRGNNEPGTGNGESSSRTSGGDNAGLADHKQKGRFGYNPWGVEGFGKNTDYDFS